MTTTNAQTFPIVKSPMTGAEYLYDYRQERVYAFDGTPMVAFTTTREWPVVGKVTCLFAWQRGKIEGVAR